MLALKNAIHPKNLNERLGHSTVAITLGIYSQTNPTLHAEAAEQIAGLILDRALAVVGYRPQDGRLLRQPELPIQLGDQLPAPLPEGVVETTPVPVRGPSQQAGVSEVLQLLRDGRRLEAGCLVDLTGPEVTVQPCENGSESKSMVTVEQHVGPPPSSP